MTTGASDLDELWRAMPPPEGPLLEARAVGTWPGGQLLAAVDSDRRRHLLIAVPDHPRAAVPRLRGLEAQTLRMRVAGREGAWLDLVLLGQEGEQVFALLGSDIVAAASTSQTADPSVVSAVVARWRRFWSGRPGALSHEAQLGLFGELWAMTRWLPDNILTAVHNWRGPLGARHDFACPSVSLEVKTAGAATGPVLHWITSLDQLADPVQGQLYLLSLRVISEATAVQTLDDLITDTRSAAAAAGPVAADELDERLAAVGWTPIHQGRYGDPFRVASQILYRVDRDFPRLTPNSVRGLPSSIVNIRYGLDTSGCAPWQVATEPQLPGPLDPLGLRS